MVELKVILDFACCICSNSINVTLMCAGKGLSAGARTVAAVNVPCPACANINQVLFEPAGTVRSVEPYWVSRRQPEPSLN
jgi:hypothetical protein